MVDEWSGWEMQAASSKLNIRVLLADVEVEVSGSFVSDMNAFAESLNWCLAFRCCLRLQRGAAGSAQPSAVAARIPGEPGATANAAPAVVSDRETNLLCIQRRLEAGRSTSFQNLGCSVYLLSRFLGLKDPRRAISQR